MLHSQFFILIFSLMAVVCSWAVQEEVAHANSADRAVASAPLKAGDDAPDFSLLATDGELRTLSKFKGKKNVVLYFYPKDMTPGCTTEAEGFKEVMPEFEKVDTEVWGVSLDNRESHKKFTVKHNLNFPLLYDAGGKVAKQYGVMGLIFAKRVTYVIGKDGKIKHVYQDVKPTGHAQEVLKFVQVL